MRVYGPPPAKRIVPAVPRPIGDDRVEQRADGKVRLSCRRPKEGWAPRRPAGHGLALHPGTAVRWEDDLWEVVAVEEVSGGSVRYELAAWDDQQAIRLLLPYDEASEAARSADRLDIRKRNGARTVVLLLAPLAGLLPGRVQERLGTELGLRPAHLTLASLPLPAAAGFFALVLMMAAAFAPGLRMAGPDVGPLLPYVAYLFPESLVRFLVVMAQDRPLGSVLGLPIYLASRAAGLVPPPDGAPASAGAAPEGRSSGDQFLMLEPLLSFLPPSDQLLLRERYGFSPVAWGKRTAWFLLVYPGLTAPAHAWSLLEEGGGLRSLALLVFSAGIAAEQVRRLRLLALGQPAPSVLGRLVAPFAKPLFVRVIGSSAPGGGAPTA